MNFLYICFAIYDEQKKSVSHNTDFLLYININPVLKESFNLKL